jgi:metal-dependent amidase/aminoacylase/carboxypeptidase family protein
LEDPALATLDFEWAFALHNLPGYPLGQVILREHAFAAASVGLAIDLEGATAHAAEPEQGCSPALAAAQIVQIFSALPQAEVPLHEAAKVTVIHVRVGEVAFGTTPGRGQVMATVRAYRDEITKQLAERAGQAACRIAEAHGLKCRIEQREPFPATRNDPQAVAHIRDAARDCSLEVHQPDHAFGWSEDFGHFTRVSRGALFGLGAGRAQPALHHPTYDFPDDLLAPAVALWLRLIDRLGAPTMGGT